MNTLEKKKHACDLYLSGISEAMASTLGKLNLSSVLFFFLPFKNTFFYSAHSLGIQYTKKSE